MWNPNIKSNDFQCLIWILWVFWLSPTWYNIDCSQLISQFDHYQLQLVYQRVEHRPVRSLQHDTSQTTFQLFHQSLLSDFSIHCTIFFSFFFAFLLHFTFLFFQSFLFYFLIFCCCCSSRVFCPSSPPLPTTSALPTSLPISNPPLVFVHMSFIIVIINLSPFFTFLEK